MKVGFNEGCNRFCRNQSVLEDVKLCDKYNIDYIDVQSECLERDLKEGKYTIEELGEAFKKSKVKMLSYNALCFFNMKESQSEKDEVLIELDKIINRCIILGCSMIVLVPSMNISVPATIDDIRRDAIDVIGEMVKKVEPFNIKLSIEFCGVPTMTINRFEEAYAIVSNINHPLVGITLDQYHFHAMASSFEALSRADGRKIFVWHLNGMACMQIH